MINKDFISNNFPNSTDILIKKKEYLMAPDIYGIHGDNVYFLYEGICGVQALTEDGNSKIYLYIKEGRFIGYVPIFRRFIDNFNYKPNYTFSIIAKTDCRFLQIDSKTFLDFLFNDKKILFSVFDSWSHDFLDILDHYHQLHEDSVVTRLCKLLINFSYEQNSQKIMPKFFTYDELANYLGVHAITVSRIMSKLLKYQYIEKQGHLIVLKSKKDIRNLITGKITIDY